MKILLLKPKAQYVLTRYADACSRLGVDLNVLMTPKEPRAHYLVSFANDSFEDIEEVPVAGDDVEALAPHLGGFDAVVASGEYSVIFGEHLSARLGVFHNPLGPVESYRNKYLMRQHFADANVSQPRMLAKFASMEEVDAFDWAGVAFPVIVKPIDLSSSFYVRLCHSADEAKKVYRRIFKHTQSFAGVTFSAQGLLEEVASGLEYSVECVIQHGRIAAMFLTRKFLSPYPACDEVAHLSGAPFDDPEMERQARAAVAGIVQAWQVTSAVMHVEFKHCNGVVKVIEAGCRIGGDMISTLVDLRHGVSLEECLVLLRCGQGLDKAFERRTPEGDGYCYGIQYLFSENLAADIPPDVEVLTTVRHAKQDSGPGGGFGVEQRLGHRLVRSRSLIALQQYLDIRSIC
ncbi:MAG: acetyl-CoA carboxylase biotin carboxylase subunit family protein [Burkholderiaceae bacterium]